MLHYLRILYQFPNWIRHFYRGATFRRQTDEKVIYLTFDDGCVPEVTPKVLEILDRYGVKATFFIVGDNARKYPDLLADLRSRGHQVGNHTFNHIKGWATPTDEYLDNVEKANELLKTHLFRPPYGRMKYSQKKALREKYEIILWDVLTHDYNKNIKPDTIMKAIRKYSRRGSIVTFHDSIKSAPNMLVVLPQAIEFWLAEGYKLETL
ncbi:MAG: polysaccharide deacetylase family protein [Paludibacteraceae bacterium]|nr:polysaccharide deacetylase family protein [Paludibacteraceae bacterium]